MKRIRLLALSLLLLAMPKNASADEGMWTLFNLPQAVYDKMVEEGLQMSCDQLYNADGALKNAVVNFSGYCTGVVVSPDGLVFTNHHCGFESIRSHSTTEHDYMLNGFFAKSYEEELPNKNMFVSFMVSQQDITDEIISDEFEKMSNMEKTSLIDSLELVYTRKIKAQDSTLRVELLPFYEGNKYYLTTYRDFTDLRLVFAPTKSMGKFGGETDNWMWPRQTCDFSVFRIYADPKTNGPAAYSEDNVPYHPSTWVPVSLQGYKPGDYAMILGYPGSTERYLSSYGIRQMRDAENTPRVQVREVKQAVMKRHMDASEAVRIKYDTKYAQSSNYWKNSMGMNKCIDSLQLIPQKQAYERKIKAYVDSTGYLKDRLDFGKMEKLYGEIFELAKTNMYWRETFRRGADFLARASKIVGELPLEGEGKLEKQYYQFPDNSDTYDEATDKEMFVATLKNFRQQVDKKYLPDFYETMIDKKFKGDYQKFADYVYKKSPLMKKDAKIRVYSKKMQKDPGYLIGMSIENKLWEYYGRLNNLYDSISSQERLLCAAILRMEEDQPHYSDANFTMRLTYGQVGGYTIGGKESGYYTTAESLLEKMGKADRINDYYSETEIQDMIRKADFGQYKDPETGKMQLCFLTNNDITGGNSGSPVFNGKGELIGLAFDGNWDALSSDIYFEHNLARTINVDIRYVLYMIDKWGHADRLIKEISPR